MINMIRILGTAILLLGSHIALIACQPYSPSTSSLESQIQDVPSSSIDGNLNVLSARDDIYRVLIIARDTSTSSESTTSTTSASTNSETSTSTSSSDTKTTSTSSTSISTSTSTSSTSAVTTTTSSASSTSSQSTITSTSTTSSSSRTTATSASTTTATASATSTTSAEIAEWNRRGNIAAIVFGCCLITLFSGISILHCARERAKSKRIAAREHMNAKAVTAESTANLIPDHSSVMLKDHSFGDQRPSTAYSAGGSSNNGWGRVSPSEQSTTEGSTPVNHSSNGDRQYAPLV